MLGFRVINQNSSYLLMIKISDSVTVRSHTPKFDYFSGYASMPATLRQSFTIRKPLA